MVPTLRRGPDPLELAGVLRRLEGLHVGVPPEVAGWLPTAPADAATATEFGSVGGAAAVAAPGEVVPPTVDAPLQARLRALLPGGLRIGILDPGRRGVAVLAVLAVLGACGGGWYFLRAAPHVRGSADAVAADALSPAAAAASATAVAPTGWPSVGDVSPGVGSTSGAGTIGGVPLGAAPSPSTASAIVVDVVGKVARPGVLTLPANSRIYEAIAAAGGSLPGVDLTALDLAGKLTDGEEIFVGIPPPSGSAAQAAGGVVGGEAPPTGSGTTSGGASGAVSVVDLNSATEAELETLPGVGAVTAQRIMAWRTQHGRFASVTQLQQVSGIGPAKYAGLIGRVKV